MSLVKQSRQKVTKARNMVFSSESELPSHYLYSIGDKWYLILAKSEKGYIGYYVCLNGDSTAFVQNLSVDQLDISILGQIFDKDIYFPGTIDLNSSFFFGRGQISSGNTTYSYFWTSDDVMVGEYRLTVITQPDPMPSNLKQYLLKLLLPKIEQEDCR
jgi:hypothetical protein